MATKSIQQVVLTNFKKHKHFAATISGDSFLLVGGNRAGKSTILQAIDHMIAQNPLPDKPVSDGEDDGEIEIMLAASGDTYRVRRKFTNKKLGRYELHRDAGNGRFDAITPAAERFQEIFGNVLDLSPLIDMSGAEQIKFIQDVIGKDSGVAEVIEKTKVEVKRLREERLWVGRNKKDAEAKQLDPDFRELVNYIGEQPISIDVIEAKRADVTELNKTLRELVQINDAADRYIATLRGIIVKDEVINIALQNVIELFEEKKKPTADIEQQIDTADETNKAVDKELEEARTRNAKIVKSAELVKVKQSIKEYEKQYEDFTAAIKKELGSISGALTKLGIGEVYEGLSLEYQMDEEGKVDKEGLFLRGLPFNRLQQSYGEMVKILVMLSKAFNPDGFGYVKISDWNLLDEANQDMVLKIAEANDIQLGIEKVDNGKEVVLQLIEK